MTRPDLTWMEHAACTRPEHHGLPWLSEPERLSTPQLKRLRLVCAACPVARSCTEHADRNHVTVGFWAGVHRSPGEPAQLALDLGHLGGTA